MSTFMTSQTINTIRQQQMAQNNNITSNRQKNFHIPRQTWKRIWKKRTHQCLVAMTTTPTVLFHEQWLKLWVYAITKNNPFKKISDSTDNKLAMGKYASCYEPDSQVAACCKCAVWIDNGTFSGQAIKAMQTTGHSKLSPSWTTFSNNISPGWGTVHANQVFTRIDRLPY